MIVFKYTTAVHKNNYHIKPDNFDQIQKNN